MDPRFDRILERRLRHFLAPVISRPGGADLHDPGVLAEVREAVLTLRPGRHEIEPEITAALAGPACIRTAEGSMRTLTTEEIDHLVGAVTVTLESIGLLQPPLDLDTAAH